MVQNHLQDKTLTDCGPTPTLGAPENTPPILTGEALYASFHKRLHRIPDDVWSGHVTGVIGLLIEVAGINPRVHLGSCVHIECTPGVAVLKAESVPLVGEVVGFRGDKTLVMAYGALEGIRPGSRVEVVGKGFAVCPTLAWKGRVLDGLGNPIDGKGPLEMGGEERSLRSAPPPPQSRLRTSERIDLGVQALNLFTTCCRGQRLGIFAGSGVGKSILMGQITRFTACDVVVVGLIGERGREVNEFLQDQLGDEGLKRAVVIVATSDTPALVRRQAAYLTLTVAEYFRDQRLNVLCLMDSVTRFAAALREVGLSVGEPPTTRGYPPTVFSELPRLLERAGTTHHAGSITGIFSVLVDGDDHNEPIADATRSILDGHVVLERGIAERGRFPAVNILKSISRTVPDCLTEEEHATVLRARRLIATYEDMAEMIQLGAYRAGSSPDVDEAIRLVPQIYALLAQDRHEPTALAEGFKALQALVAT